MHIKFFYACMPSITQHIKYDYLNTFVDTLLATFYLNDYNNVAS